MIRVWLAIFWGLVTTSQAHMDVLYARISFATDGTVKFVQFLDFSENPAVPDQATARQTLETGLGVDRGHGYEPPTVLGTPTYRVTSEWDPTTPVAYQFSNDHERPRQFLEATWTLLPKEPMTLVMPPKHPLDAVVWTVPSTGKMAKASLFYLLPGDITTAIPLEPRPRRPLLVWVILGVVVVGLVGLGFFTRKSSDT